MVDRSAIRLVVDVVCAATLVVGVTSYAMSGPPDMPAGLCPTTTSGPRYDAMLADGEITVAAVFGELEGGPQDHNRWSHDAFASALRERGFVEERRFGEIDDDRYRLGSMTIDLALIPDDLAATNAALAGALASHDVVYYTGHSHKGEIAIDPGDDYRLIVLDSCWSTQHFATRLLDARHDVITNSEMSVTGSIESFLVLVDALQARQRWPLDDMNHLATLRARKRAPISTFKEPERYRIDMPCK